MDLKLNEEKTKQKETNYYVSKQDLLEQIIISKQNDELTPKAIEMLHMMAVKLANKKHYQCPEDKQDCIQTAMLDIALYWRGFNPDKYKNPFAYYTSMLSNGLAKGWNKMYGKFKASEMTSLDNNIHSF